MVADAWDQILAGYVTPLLHRMTEIYHPSKPTLLVAVVTYSTADTLPTPILCRRYFIMGQGILPQLRKSPADFGIGLASAPDSSPMAVLEGLAAALELFDSLRDTSEVLASQLWHIAAAPPDSAAKPWWNMTTKLDDASWETLPSEMRKRDISYSAILLRPLPKLPELHAAGRYKARGSPLDMVIPYTSAVSQRLRRKVPSEQGKAIRQQNVVRRPKNRACSRSLIQLLHKQVVPPPHSGARALPHAFSAASKWRTRVKSKSCSRRKRLN